MMSSGTVTVQLDKPYETFKLESEPPMTAEVSVAVQWGERLGQPHPPAHMPPTPLRRPPPPSKAPHSMEPILTRPTP